MANSDSPAPTDQFEVVSLLFSMAEEERRLRSSGDKTSRQQEVGDSAGSKKEATAPTERFQEHLDSLSSSELDTLRTSLGQAFLKELEIKWREGKIKVK